MSGRKLGEGAGDPLRGRGLGGRVARGAGLVGLALALAVWATWPLATVLSTHAYRSSGAFAWAYDADLRLEHWILAWDVHALTTAPSRLFDANIFHPARGTLAMSEHLLGLLPLYLPLAVGSGDPVWSHQATLLLTFVAAFLAMAALVLDWTGSWTAAITAGTLFAFSPSRAENIGGLNGETNFYLPLVPLCMRRAVSSPGVGWPVTLAVTLVLQGLASSYTGAASFIATATFVATALALDDETRRRWLRLLVPIGAATLVVFAVQYPYLAAMRAGAITPRLELLWWVVPFLPTRVAGTIPCLIALAAAVFWRRGLRPGVRGTWAIALVAAVLVIQAVGIGPVVRRFGVHVPGPYAALCRIVPGFRAIRAPHRLMGVSPMGVAALAGIALAGAQRSVAAALPRRIPALGVVPASMVLALAAVSTARFLDGPFALRPIETRATVPGVYRWLASAPPGAVLELPLHDSAEFPGAITSETIRMYRSIFHWHPIVNGYGGYHPPLYHLLVAMAARLPDPEAVRALIGLAGVRYFIIEPSARTTLGDGLAAAGLHELTIGQHVVFKSDAPFGGDMPLARPLREWRGHTPSGVSLAPLPADMVASRFEEPLSPATVWGGPVRGSVIVVNRSGVAWPGIAPPGAGDVAVRANVEDGSGRALSAPQTMPLGTDVGPGTRARVPFWFRVPGEVGDYRLHLDLVQELAPESVLPIPVEPLDLPLRVGPR